MGIHLDRALILFEQARHDLAERELVQELAGDPDQPYAHCLLALCLAKREDFQRAAEEAQAAIRLAPDLAFAHYALGSIMLDRNRLTEAKIAAAEALRLDPADVDYYSLDASIAYNQRDWQGSLQSAERGLQLQPEHVGCNNLRAMALVKLGRKEEAGATIAAALAKDPENAVTHANQGWALLEQSQPQKAMEHFREALRLDPELDWARSGIVEAMKARFFLYRWLLRYFLWMAKLSGTAQWAIILGGYFGQQYLRRAARANPDLQPYVEPIIVVYIVFVLMTWLGEPLANLVLRLNKFGRLALSREQIFASDCVGTCLFSASLALAYWLATGSELALLAALFLGLLSLPVAGTFQCAAGWPRWLMAAYVLGMVGVGAAAVTCLAIAQPQSSSKFLNLFLLGTFLSGWVANILMMASVKR